MNETGRAAARSSLARALELAGRGRWREAASRFAAVVEALPAHARAWNNLGVCRMELGELDAAAECFAKALELDAAYARAADNLGLARKQQGRLVDALACFDRALVLEPALLETQAHRAGVLQTLGRIEEARDGFERVLGRSPDHAAARIGLAELHDWRGASREGLELLEPLLTCDPIALPVATVYARLQRQLGDRRRAIELLSRVLDAPGGSPDERRQAHFTLGALHDDSGDYDRAFAHFRRGNELKHASFDAAAHADYVDDLIETFNAGRLAILPRADNVSARPVFIVGLPRSGTSLIEQILDAHPRVYGAGELPAIGLIAQRLGMEAHAPYPAALLSATANVLTALAGGYLDQIAALAGGAARVTDKMPLNFLHLGLIALLFPCARVIHVDRDPLDTGISCYSQDFIDPALAFAFDLQHIGCFIGDHSRLMRHWRRLELLPMLEVRYEALVADVEGVSRRMIDFLDLEWDDACLDFHSSERFLNTASHAQVRRPVHGAAAGRHRHYVGHLQPLRDALRRSALDA